jgi:hypothetical protein
VSGICGLIGRMMRGSKTLCEGHRHEEGTECYDLQIQLSIMRAIVLDEAVR